MIDGSDDNYVQCEDIADATASQILGNTDISGLVICADPDGIEVGVLGDPSSPVRVTGTGEFITITPNMLEYRPGFKVMPNGKSRHFSEEIPLPPPPP